jgi:hypothetical protein
MSHRHLQEFFLDAMRNGYAADVEKFGIPHMNHKGISYKSKDGKLYLIDAYCINKKTGHSAGTTTIFEQGQPVWWMSYVGCYQSGTTQYLKEALKFAYDRNLFYGGRGPHEFNISGYTYRNRLDYDSFDFFSGAESLFDINGNMVGIHHYHGTVLGPRGD